jgi:murein DD-endopeptidase MepM/ murein hydrolase activator NlpD
MPTFPLDLSLSLSASERPTVDTVFADRLYPAKFGLHTGWDCNYHPRGRGGDSDHGMPVYAAFSGRVLLATDNAGGSWGGLIVVHSPHVGPEFITRYAHHAPGSCRVKVDDWVDAGDHLCGIGKGGNQQFWAHLHLDFLRKRPPKLTYWPGWDKRGLLEHFVDPAVVFAQYRVRTPRVPLLAVTGSRRMFSSAPWTGRVA